MSHDKRGNVCTDSREAFLILQSPGSIWKDKELLTSNKKEIKHAAEILKLLEVVHVLLQVAVTHCLGHQKEDSEVARRNNLADRAAKESLREHL